MQAAADLGRYVTEKVCGGKHRERVVFLSVVSQEFLSEISE
jgi:hypothetical protein